ncbi:MAG: hypothetical protein RL701_670 [Pseudomonadota bacterium]
MQNRLSSVQQALMVLLAAAFAIAVIALPAPENGRLHRALAELEAFRTQFDRPRVESALLESALAQGRQPLSALQAVARSKRVPNIQVAANAPAIEALGTLQLASLAEVENFAQPNRTLPIGVVEVAGLGKALAWRLVRDAAAQAQPAPVTLESVQLQAARVEPADLQLDGEITQLQQDQQKAAAEVATATTALTAAETLYEQRKKWKLSWKVLSKTNEARKEAKATLDGKQRALAAIETRYASATKRAERSHETQSFPPIPAFGIAQVVVSRAGANAKQTYAIPVKIAQRDVPVQSLSGAALPETQNAGLWGEVRGLDAERAIAAVRGHFTWHARHVELFGVKVGGMTVLQLLPCALPFLLLFSRRRMRKVSDSYNPFTMRVKGTFPRVGFGGRIFDVLAILVLPLAAAGFAVASLMLVGQFPALPIVVAVVCLGLAVYTLKDLAQLQALMEDVIRSHSYPPPDE